MRCPKCKSKDIVRIRYGLPGTTMLEMAQAGKIRLGGCVIDELDADWHCKNCGLAWYDIKQKALQWIKYFFVKESRPQAASSENDKANQEKWRAIIYREFDAHGPDYPVLAVMLDGSLLACHDVNQIYDAEKAGVKWLFDQKGIGLRSISGQISSDPNRTASVREIYEYLRSHDRLGDRIRDLLRGRDALFDLVKHA